MLHAFGEGYVPIVSGLTQSLLDKSNLHKSLKVVIEQVHPPKTYIELSCTAAECEYLFVIVGAIAAGVIVFHTISKSLIALLRFLRFIFITSVGKKNKQ